MNEIAKNYRLKFSRRDDGSLSFSEDNDIPPQKFTSSSTSINKNKLPSGFSKVTKLYPWKPNTTHLDIGGGKYDNGINYLRNFGVNAHVYDPFNRTDEHNQNALANAGNGKSDTVSMFNVLNVIEHPAHQVKALRLAHHSLKPNGTLYVNVWAKDGDGIGRQTGNDSWQRNEKLSAYLPLIKSVFPNATMKNGLIVATKDAANNAK